jgi:dTDP-4-amino-4,6-dideoxygalactose transaminase
VSEEVVEKPAIEGGRPVRRTFLPFCQPSISEEEIEEVSEVLRSGWLTSGPKVIEFEEHFKEYIGCDEAIATNSCTAGLHLSLLALDIGKGNEVITTPLTFASTANVVVNVGASPILVDIEKETLNIDPEKILDATSNDTRAIMPVHYAGNPCDLKRTMRIADEKGIEIIEDAAHAVGAMYGKKMIGTIGKTTSFSFYATKNMTTGEGGMVTTNDGDLAERIRILRVHGMDRDAWKRYDKGGNWYYEVKYAGHKYNMTDVQAALGLVQLRKLEEYNAKRLEMAEYLTRRLQGVSNVEIPSTTEDAERVWHLYPILIEIESLQIDRDEFIKAMLSENIGVSVHFIPIYRHPFYQKSFNFKKEDFPVSEWAYERLVSLPIYPMMKKDDLDDVLIATEKILNHYAR